jgi:hypothetical protein
VVVVVIVVMVMMIREGEKEEEEEEEEEHDDEDHHASDDDADTDTDNQRMYLPVAEAAAVRDARGGDPGDHVGRGRQLLRRRYGLHAGRPCSTVHYMITVGEGDRRGDQCGEEKKLRRGKMVNGVRLILIRW